MVRCVFRHLSGARATEVDIVLIGAHRELILGRAESAAVRFDPRQDTTVGRHHARIIPDPDDPSGLWLVDLSSRNGTLLNGLRISASASLRNGDVVQLGEGGPEVEVRMEHESEWPRHRGVG